MNSLTLEEIRTAQQRIKTRHGQNNIRLREIESGLTAKLIRFAMGELTADELDKDAAEIARLRNITDEKTAGAHEHFNRLAQQISDRARTEQNRMEILDRRRSFATQWNFIVSGTSGFSLDDVSKLQSIRTADITAPEWYRFETMRPTFGSQSEGMTYSEYANVPLINLDSIV